MIERCEETQAVIPLKQCLFDLHLPARQRVAGREALRPGQKLHPGRNFVLYCLQALLPCTRSCTHTVGLHGQKGIHIEHRALAFKTFVYSLSLHCVDV